jgi:hypothetical protein
VVIVWAVNTRAYYETVESRRALVLQPLADTLNAASAPGRFVVDDENGPYLLDTVTKARAGVWPTYKADPFRLVVRLVRSFKVRAGGTLNAEKVVAAFDTIAGLNFPHQEQA